MICLKYINEMLPLCRAIGYGEINLDDEVPMWIKDGQLLSEFLNTKIKRTRFVSLKLNEKSDVFDSLKRFFNIENISKKNRNI